MILIMHMKDDDILLKTSSSNVMQIISRKHIKVIASINRSQITINLKREFHLLIIITSYLVFSHW